MYEFLKDVPYRSEDYLDWIRGKSCIACGQGPRSEAAHQGFPGASGGGSQKPPDNQALPLCTDCHAEQHRIGDKDFWKKHPVDVKLEIIKLNGRYLRDVKDS